MSTQTLQDVVESVANLTGNKIQGYGPSKIPNEIDHTVSTFLENYIRLDQMERTKVKELLVRDHKFLLLAYAERMTSLAIRSKCRKRLLQGMFAMFVQIGIGDVREDVVILTLVHAAAVKLGLSPRDLFWDSARTFGLTDLSGLESYLRRSEIDKSLTSFGYVEGADADGFRLIRTW